MNFRSFGSPLRLVCSALLLLALARNCALLGPISLGRPETILSYSHPAQRLSVPFLRFLREVARRVPFGATVLLVLPSKSFGEEITSRFIAIGQMPDQNVLVISESALRQGRFIHVPYVACFRSEFRSPGYELAMRSELGTLSRAAR